MNTHSLEILRDALEACKGLPETEAVLVLQKASQTLKNRNKRQRRKRNG